MTDWNAILAFMSAVVPWPASPEDAGYINLQNSFVSRDSADGKRGGKYPVANGVPFREVSSLINRASWINTTTQFKDVWFCLSRQSVAKPHPRNPSKLQAVRSAANATWVKALWVDMDVGEGPKKYATVEEALKTILQFIARNGLPPASAMVLSGSGLHVYWISDVNLTPAEWAPYAHGLKALLINDGIRCDAGLTTDIARILRVPGTFNHKTEPPKPVQLLNMPLVMHNFEGTLSFLKNIAPAVIPAPGGGKSVSVFADGADLTSFKGGPVIQVNDATSLQAGIEHEEQLLDPQPIFTQCGFYRDALFTGGRDYDNVLWNLSVLGATFMENGDAISHAISKGHASYAPADTQALFNRKLAERTDRGIGYPSCATIEGAGCSACATCPLRAKGKSPLNIRPAPPPATVTATVTTPQTPAAQQLKLPETFDVNDDGIICKVIEKVSKDGETITTYVPLFTVKLWDFWAQKFPDALNYTVQVDKVSTHDATVPHSEMSKQGFRAFLGSENVRTLVNLAGAAYLEEFFLSTLSKLRSEAAAQEAVPFGWFEENGKTRGFVYNGEIILDDGRRRPCGTSDVNIKNMYTPTGDINAWFDAAKTVTDRRRPELTSIILMSFAAPLLYLTGKDGTFYSVWGSSGSGKSSAYKVGMAVWGHPILTKGSETSTRNNITTQMAEIRHLPFYWDEIKEPAQKEKVSQILHELTDGAQKGRNLTGQKTAKRGSWKLPIMVASNASFGEYLADKNKNDTASVVRMLEWKCDRIDGGPGELEDADATAILARLESNYGMVGAKYAEFLAVNHAQLATDYRKLSSQVQKDMRTTHGHGTSERYWLVGSVIMILAARYAKSLGLLDVDEAEIKNFFYDVIRKSEDNRKATGFTDGVQAQSTEEVLALYLKKRMAEERVIWTNYMHNVVGKPPKPVMLLGGTSQARNNAGGIEVRVAQENREIIIAKRDFDDWVTQHGHQRGPVLEGIIHEYGGRVAPKMALLSGTIYGVGTLREPTIVIPVDPLSPFWDYVMRFATPEDRAKAEAGVAALPTPTGLEDIINAGQSEAGEDTGTHVVAE